MGTENFFKSESENRIAPDTTTQPKTQIVDDYTVNEPERDDGISKKSRLVALLLGIFLGSYGAHNFYLGKPKRAVIQLALCIIGYIVMFGPLVSMYTEMIGLAIQNPDALSDDYAAEIILSMMGKMILGYVIIAIPSIWSLVEWIMVAAGVAKDSSGRLVKNW